MFFLPPLICMSSLIPYLVKTVGSLVRQASTLGLVRTLTSNLLVRGNSSLNLETKPPNQYEICIYDAESGQLVGEIPQAHPAIINCLLSVGEDVWSGSEDGSVKAWNIQVFHQHICFHSPKFVKCLVFHARRPASGE